MKAIVLTLGLILVSVSGFAQSDSEPQVDACDVATLLPGSYEACRAEITVTDEKKLACGRGTHSAEGFAGCLMLAQKLNLTAEDITKCAQTHVTGPFFRACAEFISDAEVIPNEVSSCAKAAHMVRTTGVLPIKIYRQCLGESAIPGVTSQKIDVCGDTTTLGGSFILCLKHSPYLSVSELEACGHKKPWKGSYENCLGTFNSYGRTDVPIEARH